MTVSFPDEGSTEVSQVTRDTTIRTADTGVNIISGSNSNLISRIGILEIEKLDFSGPTPVRIVPMTTINSAELLGADEGQIQTSKTKPADLIVLEKNFLDSFSSLLSVVHFIKFERSIMTEVNEDQASFWNLHFLDD